MDSVWPWLAVAGSGALHGLNPAAGWIFAAAWTVRSGDRGRVWRALVPIAVGHLAAVALVGAALALGATIQRTDLVVPVAALLLAGAAAHLSGCRLPVQCRPAGHAGLALWSFLVAGAHGAGMTLAPTLVALCASPGRGMTPAVGFAVGAVLVHAAGMLAAMWLVAGGIHLISGCPLLSRMKGGRKVVPGARIGEVSGH